ncbi:MAG: Pycsar system effector family protein [Prosthecobacter sp.]|uniref:Pycsar system effector family protein n=1 Tax=Prosthecobacter sp. TaxID=1965333 RepID=UPI003BAFCCD9
MQPVAPSSSAANLLGTITTLVKDTQVDVTRLIYMLYQDIEHQINRADLKAQLTLSTSAVLMAMIVNMGPGLRMHGWAGLRLFEYVVLALYALFILCMSFAFGRGIAAAFPRAVKKAPDTNRHPNLYFSGQIAKIPGDEYADLFCLQSNDGVKRSVLGQVHSKCIVLEAKLYNVRKGMTCLLLALGIWITARLVLLIGNGFE